MRPSDFRNLSPDRNGGYIRTFSGRRFWPLDPRPEDIDIIDIAHALSMVNRFNGHSIFPYSVAQHSVMVSRIVHPRFAFEGLMHDASEAFIADLVSPAKKGMREYRRVEKRIMDAIRARFGMLAKEPPEVKAADYEAYESEAFFLIPGEVPAGLPPPKHKIRKMTWQQAEKQFLNRYHALYAGHYIGRHD